MYFKQILDERCGCASYLIASRQSHEAAIIDPSIQIDQYDPLLQDRDFRLRTVIDTHVHADHVSTGYALAIEAGARYVLHADVDARFPFHGARDGDRIEIGNVLVDVWHVPGHTPEHIALVVTDRTRAAEPWLVFTGHTLMVGDMGRTELASSAEEGARSLFESAERLRALPDYVQVMPGAFAGSVCGRGLSATPFSTIGFERRFNRAFSIPDRAAFVDFMLREIPPRPPRAVENRRANLGIDAAGDGRGMGTVAELPAGGP
jgi:glyoxylase-like metal-dependent hydrolase (beta-lactamase superfamily II)